MLPSVFEHVLTSWYTRCPGTILHYPCPNAKINTLSKDFGCVFFPLEIIFRNQNMDARYAHCYWVLLALSLDRASKFVCACTLAHLYRHLYLSLYLYVPGHLLVLPCPIVKINGKPATKTGRAIRSLESSRIQTWATLPGKEPQAAVWRWGKSWRRQSQTSVTTSWLVLETTVLLAYYTCVYLYELISSFRVYFMYKLLVLALQFSL